MPEAEILQALKDAREIALELICDEAVGYMWCRVFYRIEEQIYALDPLGSPFPFTKVKRTLNEQVFGLALQAVSRDEFIEEVKEGRF